MKFYAATNDALYEQTRLALDAAWGLPNQFGLVTCIDPAAKALRDSQGRILMAITDEWLEWPPVLALFPNLLASGAMQEISRAAYDSVANPEVPL